ncbi:MAG: hypothetical protein OEQ25_04610 [Gammaproteobacteria bacterium]|nr:hypothetical protein [Gammaproteobacteria bacterium]MDH3506403.1 hypothetical protein [Gammaproteobacteria bacterium]
MRRLTAFVAAALAASLVWHGSVAIDDLLLAEEASWQLGDFVYPLIITPIAMLVLGVPLHLMLRLSGRERTTDRVLAGAATGAVFAAVFWLPGAQAVLTGAAAGASASAIFYRLRDVRPGAGRTASSNI